MNTNEKWWKTKDKPLETNENHYIMTEKNHRKTNKMENHHQIIKNQWKPFQNEGKINENQ